MRRRGDYLRAGRGGGASEREAGLHVCRPVVEPREDVAVEVDHRALRSGVSSSEAFAGPDAERQAVLAAHPRAQRRALADPLATEEDAVAAGPQPRHRTPALASPRLDDHGAAAR